MTSQTLEPRALDLSVPARLGQYLWRLVQFDLGFSAIYGKPVATVIAERLPPTLLLMLARRRSLSCLMERSLPLLLEMELPPITSIHSDRVLRTSPRFPVDDIRDDQLVSSQHKFNRQGTCSLPAG